MSPPVVLIGYILLIPFVITAIFFGLVFINAVSDPRDEGTGFAATFALAIAVTAFVGGLLGWLLVMKKSVLKCSVCGAVVNAA